MKNKIIIPRIKGSFFIISCFFSSYGLTDVTLDGSMGSAGTLNGPNYQIKQELGRQEGNNLFHSFGRFNLTNTESATFSGSPNIRNVISRVTGGQRSDINGSLNVNIPGANLYLLNPAGIIFGKDATVNVTGAFHASTADVLKFQDGVHLKTGNITTTPILTTAEPEAFGFLDDNPAPIQFTGGKGSELKVSNGKTLSLTGGDITLENGSISAPGGQIYLTSVGSVGDVRVTGTGLDTSSFKKMGDIHLSQANVDVSADTAGRVFIRGGQMVMDNANIKSDTTNGKGQDINISLTDSLTIKGFPESLGREAKPAGISADTLGIGTAGNITVNAEHLNIQDNGRISALVHDNGKNGKTGDLTINAHSISIDGNKAKNFTGIFNQTSKGSSGKAGNLTLDVVDHLNIKNGGEISTSILGSGKGGDLLVKTQKLFIDREHADSFTGITIQTEEGSSGNAGNLTLDVNHLNIKNGGAINTSIWGSGNGGNLQIINAQTIDIAQNQSSILTGISNQARKGSSGNTGDLIINTDNLTIHRGGQINASTFGDGKGGNVWLDAPIININGSQSDERTGITIQTQGDSFGKTGNLNIKADQLNISNGGTIIAGTFGRANSGDLIIDAQKISIKSDRPHGFTGIKNRVEQYAIGNTGILKVNAQDLFITGDTNNFTGILSQTAQGSFGNAGDLILDVNHLNIANGGEISASTGGKGDGGHLMIKAHSSINIDDNRSKRFTGITNQAIEGSFGNSGDLMINTSDLNIINGGEISASTSSSVSGGDLSVTAKTIKIDAGSSSVYTGITNQAKEGSGSAGKLTIDVNDLKIINGGEISASTSSSASGGDLSVTAKTIKIDAGSSSVYTGITNQAKEGSGSAGKLTIDVNDLKIINGGIINANTLTTGNAGDLTIIANNILLKDKSSINAISAYNPSSPDGTTANKAMSGNIDITVNESLYLENSSSITVDTKKANAGMIKIEGNGIVKMDRGSEITTSVANGQGEGGDISIFTPTVFIDGGKIIANAIEGMGGNILITSSLIESPNSIIKAESKKSVDGKVNLKPTTDISGSISELPDVIMALPTLLNNHCEARSQTHASSFVIKSDEIILPEPGDLAPSNFKAPTNHSSQKSDSLDKPFPSPSLEQTAHLSAMLGSCIE